jgi:hypothetical protein
VDQDSEKLYWPMAAAMVVFERIAYGERWNALFDTTLLIDL